jgi:multidrug efflux pump subunit AcrA (membrane-fusion protein)
VEARVVDIGPSDKGMVVIHKGVEVGEMVVTDGQVRITPGVTVEWKSGEVPAQGKQS